MASKAQSPALAAGVNDTGFLQHRVLIDCVGQGNFGFFHGSLVDKFKVAVFLGSLSCLGRRQAGNCENGALSGLHDRFVGGVHALLEGVGPQDAVALRGPFQSLGNAAEQQAQDDAGVAPRSPQHGGGGNGSRLFQGGVFGLLQVCHSGVDGHGHVGTGVAVRHREHVQLVDRLLVDFNRGGRADDQSAKIGPVDGLPQWNYTSEIGTSPMYKMGLPNHHGINVDIDSADLGTGAFVHHIADLRDDGSAHGSQVHPVVHHNVQINGDGIIFVELDPDAFAHGFFPQQVDQAHRS